MTQHELAERAGLHRQAIAKLETGVTKPTWESVQALARALGVNCSAFETEEPPAAEPARPRGRPRKDAGEDEGKTPPAKKRKRRGS